MFTCEVAKKLTNTNIQFYFFGNDQFSMVKNKIKKDSKENTNNNLKTVNKDLLQSKLNETIKEAKNNTEDNTEVVAKKIVNSSDIKLDSKNKVDNSEFGVVKKKIEDNIFAHKPIPFPRPIIAISVIVSDAINEEIITNNIINKFIRETSFYFSPRNNYFIANI